MGLYSAFVNSLWTILCLGCCVVYEKSFVRPWCVYTHVCQDFCAAIELDSQEDIRGCWFCALKMHDLTKIRQSHKSHLP